MSREVEPSKPFVRDAKIIDVIILAANIRQCDRWEIWHMSRSTPYDAFKTGYDVSDRPMVIEHKGQPIAMFGVSGVKESIGIPWMLGTDGIEKIKKSFLRECKDYVEAMHDEYDVLTNYVWSKNIVHIGWLKWLGFQFGETKSLGPDNELFIHFQKVKHNV
jgi:hypothetical protein